MSVVIKSFFHINDDFKKHSKVKNISLYQHIASNSYRNYLKRKPKSIYVRDAKKIIRQGEKLQDQKLIDKGYRKLHFLQNNEVLFYEKFSNQKVKFLNDKVQNNFEPLHINLIISPGKLKHFNLPYPLAYLHYYYLDITKHLKHNQNKNDLWNYYGAYHNDTLHPHFHLVIYQNEYGYKKKPLNTLDKARQIYSSQVLKEIKQRYNFINNKKSLSFAFNHEIIEKLIEKIKTFNPLFINNKQIFVCKWLLKALKININNLDFNYKYRQLYNTLINHKNFYARPKNDEELFNSLKHLVKSPKDYSLGLLININQQVKDDLSLSFYKDLINDIKNLNFEQSIQNLNQKVIHKKQKGVKNGNR